MSLKAPEGTGVTASAEFGGNTFTEEKQSDGTYVVKAAGIKASQFGDTVTVTGEADGSFTVNVSTLSYVRSVLDNPDSREDAKNALCALYRFCEAVKNYRP